MAGARGAGDASGGGGRRDGGGVRCEATSSKILSRGSQSKPSQPRPTNQKMRHGILVPFRVYLHGSQPLELPGRDNEDDH
ncbi:hypothetical protein RIF29_24773 [Crotalaria pallida]|uniref:Uncharacterized protein n=1 Tax=Crotalaria pallida TaxID=3830 RepID=A0AAN9ESL4_CROPI